MRERRTTPNSRVRRRFRAGDRLASWTGGSYTYDAAGCVTHIARAGRPTLDLAWNGRYQLVSASTNGVFAESYAYDALGRRVSTTTLEGTVRHVYDDDWQCIADIDENGNVLCSYVWGEGIDKLLTVKVGGNVYYPLTDIQGTVWGYVDSQNNLVACWMYDAWGNVLSEFCAVPSLVFVRYRFQCREWSAATGLINFRMRWYDPVTGRWLSKDPIRLVGGLNLYMFCRCVPNVFKDPMGLDIWIGNRWPHQNINVGDPDGEYCSYSFGADDRKRLAYVRTLWPWNEIGVVYRDDPPDDNDPNYHLKTTPLQDKRAKEILEGMVDDHWAYRILGPNCRTFSHEMFNFFQEEFSGR